MKLLRFGEAGNEKPGILIDDEILDVSSFGEDFGETFFERDGISRLASWLKSNQSFLDSPLNANCSSILKSSELEIGIMLPISTICGLLL